MGFASQMVGRSTEIYKAAVQKAKDPALKETLQGLLEEEETNCALMERTRRENVVEMILEPITGLHSRDYEVDVQVSDRTRDVDLLKVALILEEKERRFFYDCSETVPLPEVTRIFRKIAQKKEKNLTKLNSLGLKQLL
jgi:rubrerythrin